MNNKFINNGANLLNTKNKKTKVESQIEVLKRQEQEILKELNSCEIKNKKVDKFLNYLSEVARFSTKLLTEAVEQEKSQNDYDIY